MTARRETIVAVAALAGALAIVSWRTRHDLNVPNAPQLPRYAMQDFRDVAYYPAVAFLAGDNPYDRPRYRARYPVGQDMALYSPLLMVLHAPLATLPYRTAELVYYLAAVALTIALAALSLSYAGARATIARVAWLSAVLVLSRPGHWNLFAGQVTLQAVLPTMIALWYGDDRPWLAGVALAIATFKPTYGLPLAVLLLARGAWRAVAIGAAVATVVTAIALTVLVAAAGSPRGFVDSIASTYAARATVPRKLEQSPTRVDVVAGIARVFGRAPGDATTLALTLGVLGFAAVGVRRLARVGRPDAHTLATSLACVAIVACAYHHQYDLLMLALPLAILVWRPDAVPWREEPALRAAALAVVALLLVNYLSSATLVQTLDLPTGAFLALASIDGVAHLALLAIFGGAARMVGRTAT